MAEVETLRASTAGFEFDVRQLSECFVDEDVHFCWRVAHGQPALTRDGALAAFRARAFPRGSMLETAADGAPLVCYYTREMSGSDGFELLTESVLDCLTCAICRRLGRVTRSVRRCTREPEPLGALHVTLRFTFA